MEKRLYNKPKKTIYIPGISKKLDIFYNKNSNLYYTNFSYELKDFGGSKRIDLSKMDKTIPKLLERIKDKLSIEKNTMDRKNSNSFWEALMFLKKEVDKINNENNYSPQLNNGVENK